LIVYKTTHKQEASGLLSNAVCSEITRQLPTAIQ